MIFSCPSTAKVVAFLGVAATVIYSASARCTREGLLAAANSYLAAQVSGKMDGLKFDATNFTYQENNKKADIAKGLLSQPLKIDLNRSTADTVACASYSMFISSTGSKPYVVGTQIRHSGNDTNTIAAIDSIVATTGALFFDAKQTLSYIQKESWSTLDAGQRPSRALLQQVGDAYLDMWTDAKAADTIP